MAIWSSEIKELEKLYESIKGQLSELEKELGHLMKTEDENVIMLYSRRCLEVIITDLCECELRRPRKTEPLKGIIDKLNKEEKVPSHIIASMHGLNELSTYGTHPKDFDPEQVKPVLINLDIIIKWYLKYKNIEITGKQITIEKVYNEKPGDKSIRYKKKKIIYYLASLCVIIAVVILFVFSSGSTLPFSRRDWILITDFENLTENPVFDKSLYTAFTLTTSQSRYINVFPRSKMLESLARMKIDDQTLIDEKMGREMAIREGVNLYIVPGISETGNRYAVTARIMDTKSGDPLRSEILYAETLNDILPTLDRLSRRIRQDLGESKYNIALQDKPLKKVTTSSLEALKLYSLGIDRHYLLDFEGAKNYYEDALRIDTGFTTAKASLGNINIRAFDPVKGREYLLQAVKAVDNLTDRERLSILALYAAQVENNIPKNLEYERMLVELYPDDPIAHNNMGYSYQVSGEYEKAVQEYKEAIRIDPNAVIAYGGLLWIYLDYLGEPDSALIWSSKMIKDNPQNAWGYLNMGSAWLCLDSLSKAEEAYIRALKINPDLILNLYRLAHVYRLQKKYDKAIGILKRIPEINQNETSAYYDLGVNYQSMGNQKEANKYFSIYKKAMTMECLKQRQITAESFISLAEVMARLGEIDSSEQTLQKAIIIDSTQNVKFAEVLCLQGKVIEAIEELEEAFENGYRNLFWLKLTPDLQILQYDTRYRDLLDKYFKQKL